MANKKGGKGKKPRGNKPRKARLPNYGISLDKLVEAACSQYDAFCPAARLAKLMDEDSEYSVPYQVRYTVPLTTITTTGAAVVTFAPLLKQSYRVASVVANNIVTTDGAWVAVPEQTNLESSFVQYRIVSWGVRVVDTSAATASQGLITAKVMPAAIDLEAVGWQGTAIRYVPLKGCSLTFLAKKKGPRSREYQLTPTVWAAGYQFPTDSVSIWITGGPATATTVGTIEVVYNLECVPNVNTVAARTATPAAPSNIQVTQASGNAAATLPGLYTSDPGQTIRRAMGNALTYGGGAVGGLAGAGLTFAGQMMNPGRAIPANNRLTNYSIRDVD